MNINAIGIVVLFLLFKNNQSQNEQMSLQEYYSYSKSNFHKIRFDQAVGLIPQHLDIVVIGFFSDFYSAGIYRIAKRCRRRDYCSARRKDGQSRH